MMTPQFIYFINSLQMGHQQHPYRKSFYQKQYTTHRSFRMSTLGPSDDSTTYDITPDNIILFYVHNPSDMTKTSTMYHNFLTNSNIYDSWYNYNIDVYYCTHLPTLCSDFNAMISCITLADLLVFDYRTIYYLKYCATMPVDKVISCSSHTAQCTMKNILCSPTFRSRPISHGILLYYTEFNAFTHSDQLIQAETIHPPDADTRLYEEYLAHMGYFDLCCITFIGYNIRRGSIRLAYILDKMLHVTDSSDIWWV